jgi:hypothetical protein
LLHHQCRKIFLTFRYQASNESFFTLFTNQLNLIFKKLDHTLQNKIFKCIFVQLWVSFHDLDKTNFGLLLKFFETFVATIHSFNSCLVCFCASCNLLLNRQVISFFFVLFTQHGFILCYLLVTRCFKNALA